MEDETQDQDLFQEWALLELMGHRKLFGLVQETAMPGNLYRIDVYVGDDDAAVLTQFYGPAAVYSITPMAENVVRRMARGCQPEPVTRWELPLPEEGEGAR